MAFLDLCETGVTDRGLRHLAGLVKLRMLDVRDTAVSEAGVQQLQVALPLVVIRQHSDGKPAGGSTRRGPVSSDLIQGMRT